MSQSLWLLMSFALGFAVANLLIVSYQIITARPASFRLITLGGVRGAVAVPFLVFAAPAIIMRNTIRGRRIQHRPIEFVFLATLIACFWSLAAGRTLVVLLGLGG